MVKINTEDHARELKNAYLREWRAKHPENVRQHNKNYWMKRAEAETVKEGDNNEKR